MAREKKREEGEDLGVQMNMTPMIDIVFQLLIFFMFTMEFKMPEGNLKSYLPRDRGQNTSPAPVVPGVRISLIWLDEPEMRCIAKANFTRDFQMVQEKDRYRGIEFILERPDWDEMRQHIRERKQNYRSPDGREMPVIIDFEPEVPMRFVAKVTDICTELRIGDVSFAQREVEEGIE